MVYDFDLSSTGTFHKTRALTPTLFFSNRL
jgi:hypothetical protein